MLILAAKTDKVRQVSQDWDHNSLPRSDTRPQLRPQERSEVGIGEERGILFGLLLQHCETSGRKQLASVTCPRSNMKFGGKLTKFEGLTEDEKGSIRLAESLCFRSHSYFGGEGIPFIKKKKETSHCVVELWIQHQFWSFLLWIPPSGLSCFLQVRASSALLAFWKALERGLCQLDWDPNGGTALWKWLMEWRNFSPTYFLSLCTWLLRSPQGSVLF